MAKRKRDECQAQLPPLGCDACCNEVEKGWLWRSTDLARWVEPCACRRRRMEARKAQAGGVIDVKAKAAGE